MNPVPSPAPRIFAPGCGLMLYKPHLATRLHEVLVRHLGPMDMTLTCCRHVPPVPPGTEVINVCPGCDRRYRENYKQSTTISLWEVLALSSFFPFPDYGNREMTIIDACPTRNRPGVHEAIRELARRMNIRVTEPRKTRTKGTCCGDSSWGVIPTRDVVRKMKKKAGEMPCEDVIVYCVSCSKAMFIGSRRPHYMIDLLLREATIPGTCGPDAWHHELDAFINSHRPETPVASR